MDALWYINDGHHQGDVHQSREDPEGEANHQGSTWSADVVGLKRGADDVIAFHRDCKQGKDAGVGGQVLAVVYEIACRERDNGNRSINMQL